jgi:hypothetical protein
MTEYRLYLSGPGEVLAVVYELRNAGLQQGTDFDFEWHVTKWENENFSFNVIEPSHGRFKFYNESWGTWFALKYL